MACRKCNGPGTPLALTGIVDDAAEAAKSGGRKFQSALIYGAFGYIIARAFQPDPSTPEGIRSLKRNTLPVMVATAAAITATLVQK